MYNPSNITLIGENLNCLIFRQDDNILTLLGNQTMDPCKFESEKRICVKTNITITYLKYFMSNPGKLLPDWIILRIEGDFFVAGTRQAFPITLNAYVNPHILKD